MAQFLSGVWGFEYAIIPCVVAYVVFDFPILIRRITRRLYVPVYFAFFPFGYSDELYARYFNEDHYFSVGGPISADEVSTFRTKIIWTSVLSLALTMALSPFISALFSHYLLTDAQAVQFFYTLAIVKAALLSKSLYDLRWNFSITSVVPISYIATIYVLYWAAILTFFDRSLTWIEARDAEGGLPAIANSLLDFLFFDIGIQIVFVSLIGALLPWRLTKGTAQPTDYANGNDA